MFADPRSGTERRAQYPRAIVRKDDKRGRAERRTIREPRTSERWWLMRSYVSAEKFLGGILR
jgi:hypothetical protein